MRPRQISRVFVFADAQLPQSLSTPIPLTVKTQDLQWQSVLVSAAVGVQDASLDPVANTHHCV